MEVAGPPKLMEAGTGQRTLNDGNFGCQELSKRGNKMDHLCRILPRVLLIHTNRSERRVIGAKQACEEASQCARCFSAVAIPVHRCSRIDTKMPLALKKNIQGEALTRTIGEANRGPPKQ